MIEDSFFQINLMAIMAMGRLYEHMAERLTKWGKSASSETKGVREGLKKYGLFPPYGGGSPTVIKNHTAFLEKYFFSVHAESF